ncbi:hypothetical protein GCM10009785_35130 [Brooklawnia cerclae]|uniref:Uncharacterized protein n=1 Tax=Brooklawnia cerclae TaxID=349934 RepID=A0ABX0SDF5_9ACTN|nr:hypothetical protein [Brooklawnia cerclae]NIH55358.1 hypothetical protein [Brooklawnia cerclae]
MNARDEAARRLLALAPEEAREAVRTASDEVLRAAVLLAGERPSRVRHRAAEPTIEPRPRPVLRVPEEWRRPVAVVIDGVAGTTQEQASAVREVGVAACGQPGAVYRSRWVVPAPRSGARAVEVALRALAAGEFTAAEAFVRGRFE